jgi:TatD-related deoxyribonuclease
VTDPASQNVGPVLDDHLHLDPLEGRNQEAVRAFDAMGGTHLLVVNKPSWSLGVEVDSPEDFRTGFDLTCEAVAAATRLLRGRAWPVLGVHPALISRLCERGWSPAAARELMEAGLDVAAEYVERGDALALKSGRPHYDVADAVWAASNEVMCHAFELAAQAGCAVQLHTETGSDFDQLTSWARTRGLDAQQVVKHFAGPETHGPVPSVVAREENILGAIEADRPFMLETDFIDDPDRPGAVLGPKTVPKRTAWLRSEGYVEAVRQANVTTPARVYGIDTEATLDGRS